MRRGIRNISPKVFAQRYAASSSAKIDTRTRQLARVNTQIAGLKQKIPTLECYEKLSIKRRATANNRQKRVVVLEARRRALESEIVGLQAVDTVKMEAAYAAIFQVPRVHRVGMHDGKIVVVTKTLYGKRIFAPRTWHRLGRYRITIDPDHVLSLNWDNLDYPGGFYVSGRERRYVAPQIDRNGSRGCLGEAAENALWAARDANNLAGLIAVAIRFAESPGIGTSYNDVLGAFPKVPSGKVPAWYTETFGR